MAINVGHIQCRERETYQRVLWPEVGGWRWTVCGHQRHRALFYYSHHTAQGTPLKEGEGEGKGRESGGNVETGQRERRESGNWRDGMSSITMSFVEEFLLLCHLFMFLQSQSNSLTQYVLLQSTPYSQLHTASLYIHIQKSEKRNSTPTVWNTHLKLWQLFTYVRDTPLDEQLDGRL